MGHRIIASRTIQDTWDKVPKLVSNFGKDFQIIIGSTPVCTCGLKSTLRYYRMK